MAVFFLAKEKEEPWATVVCTATTKMIFGKSSTNTRKKNKRPLSLCLRSNYAYGNPLLKRFVAPTNHIDLDIFNLESIVRKFVIAVRVTFLD